MRNDNRSNIPRRNPRFPETPKTEDQDSCNNKTFPQEPSGQSLKKAREEDEENSHNFVDSVNNNNKILYVCNIGKALNNTIHPFLV